MTLPNKELVACLPASLRTPEPTFTRVAMGQSGAAVYHVAAGAQAFVLKVASAQEPPAEWQPKLQLQRLVAGAGLAPTVVHADEERRAVLSVFVADRSFRALYFDPSTRATALGLVARTLRRLHDLPLPPEAQPRDSRSFLGTLWPALSAGFPLPPFVGDAVAGLLAEEPPACNRAPVMSHNDCNPSNLIYDGERLVVLDWDTAGPNDPYYDLATIALFLRMDEATCRALLALHDGEEETALPARFRYDRRLVAVLCGTLFLHLARQSGRGGSSEAIEAAPALGEVYQRLRDGALDLGSAEGRWQLGLALVKESVGMAR
jgi:aminoglycoside phosphotransferase